MGFWDDVARIGQAIATGGASELARAVASGEAEKRRREEELQRLKQLEQQRAQTQVAAAGGKGSPCGGVEVPPPPSMRFPSGEAGQGTACCRYELHPPFLLDAHSGRVWRYEQKNDSFLIVTREATKVEKSWESLLAAKLTADLVDNIQDATRGSSLAEYKRVGPRLDAHLALMEKEL